MVSRRMLINNLLRTRRFRVSGRGLGVKYLKAHGFENVPNVSHSSSCSESEELLCAGEGAVPENFTS